VGPPGNKNSGESIREDENRKAPGPVLVKTLVIKGVQRGGSRGSEILGEKVVVFREK